MDQALHSSAIAAPPAAFRWLALFASAFWIHYFLVHDVFGLLTVDEIYFAHVFWLMGSGLDPYADFFSAHLPAYFRLLSVLVRADPGPDLSFVWLLRATNLAVACVYVWLLFRLCRREFLFLLPVLFMFVALGRMAEIRPDTFGLLLANVGWFWLLRRGGRTNMLLAAAFALLAMLFSARAAIVVTGFGLLLLYLCYRRRDAKTFLLLAGLAAAFALLIAAQFAADPAGFERMVHSVYFATMPYVPTVPLWQRFLPVDRLLLVLALTAALFGAGLRLRRGFDDRAAVIAAACVTQFVLILVDPSPFQYVYGWAMLPVLAGLALLVRSYGPPARAALVSSAAAVTIAMLSVSLGSLASGAVPRPGSFVRISYDAPFEKGALQSLSLPQLMRMLVTTERQEGLWNQLALYSEICRRVDGPVLTRFYASPICLPDVRYDWAGLKWADLLAGEPARMPRARFAAMLAQTQPRLIAWGKQHFTPPLSDWGKQLLRDYDVHEGFAIRREAAEASASAR